MTADVATQASPAELVAELRAREQSVLALPNPSSVFSEPQIQATREAYKALGKDPARYRGSAEALLRRVVQGKGLPLINNVVDIINLVSVESLLPLGLYDLERVRATIVFRAGRAGETYKGIGKYALNLEGLPVFCDELGPFGSPTSDSERTMVTAAAKKILLVVISFGGAQGIERWTARAADLLARYASASHVESTAAR
ncbi:MAG TPA: phenylalanine--tRNA ligase beta subunit-related protein [Candidatus Acidoferrales bacterium]|nr:phenylalanine--tRNA ligase beta subunit-related protein [Candidatus Acidoferrales bacterium]